MVAAASPVVAALLGACPSAVTPDATIRIRIAASPYALFILVLLNYCGAAGLFLGLVLVHHHTGGTPHSVLLDDHTKNIEIAVQAVALAVVALNSGVIRQNRHIAENMRFHVFGIEQLQCGAVRPP